MTSTPAEYDILGGNCRKIWYSGGRTNRREFSGHIAAGCNSSGMSCARKASVKIGAAERVCCPAGLILGPLRRAIEGLVKLSTAFWGLLFIETSKASHRRRGVLCVGTEHAPKPKQLRRKRVLPGLFCLPCKFRPELIEWNAERTAFPGGQKRGIADETDREKAALGLPR